MFIYVGNRNLFFNLGQRSREIKVEVQKSELLSVQTTLTRIPCILIKAPRFEAKDIIYYVINFQCDTPNKTYLIPHVSIKYHK